MKLITQKPYHVAAECLKLPKKTAENVLRIQERIHQLTKIKLAKVCESEVLALALWQRESGAIWRALLLMHDAIYQRNYHAEVEKVLLEANLINFWERPALMRGEELVAVFGVKGKQVGEKVRQMIEYMARFPHKTKEDFISEFKA